MKKGTEVPTIDDDEILLNEREVAKLCAVSLATVRRWRNSRPRSGPPVVKIASIVRYRRANVEAWIERSSTYLDVKGDGVIQIRRAADRAAKEALARVNELREAVAGVNAEIEKMILLCRQVGGLRDGSK